MIEQLLAYVPQILQYLAALFTGAEWKALLMLVMATLCLTHVLKIAWRLAPFTKGGSAPLINFLFAPSCGLALAFPVWRGMAHDDIPWYVAGVIAGPLAIYLFKFGFLLLKWKAPDLAAMINADRRKDPQPLPPAGMAERRKS